MSYYAQIEISKVDSYDHDDYDFQSFGEHGFGQMVTQYGNNVVLWAPNPYGSRNLIIVDDDTGEAWAHGNSAVLAELAFCSSKHAYRKTRRFLAEHGKCADWCLLNKDGTKPYTH